MLKVCGCCSIFPVRIYCPSLNTPDATWLMPSGDVTLFRTAAGPGISLTRERLLDLDMVICLSKSENDRYATQTSPASILACDSWKWNAGIESLVGDSSKNC